MDVVRRTGVDLSVAFASAASAPPPAPSARQRAPRPVPLLVVWVARRVARIIPRRGIARSLALRIVRCNSHVENYCRVLYREMRSGGDVSLGSSFADWYLGLMAGYAKKLIGRPFFRSVAFRVLRRNERLSAYCRRLVRAFP
jgi:hypothetical protein